MLFGNGSSTTNNLKSFQVILSRSNYKMPELLVKTLSLKRRAGCFGVEAQTKMEKGIQSHVVVWRVSPRMETTCNLG